MATVSETFYYPSREGNSSPYGRIRIRAVQEADTDAGTSNVTVNLEVASSYYGSYAPNQSITVQCIGKDNSEIKTIIAKSNLYSVRDASALFSDESGNWRLLRSAAFTDVAHNPSNKALSIKLYFTGTSILITRQNVSPASYFTMSVPSNGDYTFYGVATDNGIISTGSGSVGSESLGNDSFYVPGKDGWVTNTSSGSFRRIRFYVTKTGYDSSAKIATVSISVQLRWDGGTVGARPNLTLNVNGTDLVCDKTAASVSGSWLTVQTFTGIQCPYDANGICAIDIRCLPTDTSKTSPYYLGGPVRTEEWGYIYYYWAIPKDFGVILYLDPIAVTVAKETEINSVTDGVGSNDATVVEESKTGNKITYYIPNSTGYVVDKNGKRYFRLKIEETAGSSSSTVTLTTQIKGSPTVTSVKGNGHVYVSVGTGSRQRIACDDTTVATNTENFVDVQTLTLNNVAFGSKLKIEFLGKGNSTDPNTLCGYYKTSTYTVTRDEYVEVGSYKDYVRDENGNAVTVEAWDPQIGGYVTSYVYEQKPIIQHNVITETITEYYYFGVKAGTVVNLTLSGSVNTGTQPDFGGDASGIRIWNGSAWVLYNAFIWNGSAWVRYDPYIWNGTAFVKQG